VVSRCLLGEHVRYDGGHKHAPRIIEILAAHADIQPVCPEVEAGMPIPREPMSLTGSPLDVRVTGNVSNKDYTPELMPSVNRSMDRLQQLGVHGFVLKSRSPSCASITPVIMKGMKRACGRSGGQAFGVFAAAAHHVFPGLPFGDEVSLSFPAALEMFLRQARRAARSEEETS
jgi:uncharacterized protein YbbK (DUF523 family)